MIRDLDIYGATPDKPDSRSWASLAQFYKVFPGELLHQPFEFEAEEGRGDGGAWQIAFGRDLINGGFGGIDGIIDPALLIREWRKGAGSGFGRRVCFGQKDLQIVQNVGRAHHQLGSLLDQAVRTHGARGINMAGDGIDRPP